MNLISQDSLVEERLAQEDPQLFIRRMRIALYYMAVPLVLCFTLVDHFFSPENWLRFLIARLLVIPVSFILYKLYKRPKFNNGLYRIPAYLFILFLSALNTYMAWVTGGEASPYYAGLNLVGIAAFGFLPWGLVDMIIAGLLLYGPWFVSALFLKNNIEPYYFVTHSAFILSTCMISGIITYITYQLRRAELRSRIALEQQVTEQDDVIQSKTNEGVYLEKLTSQFSPQVVEAIKSQEISISRRQRREVTCIFIDVENSTSRSLKIDYNKYVEVLSDFFSKCVEIFLKHDVTVGTYLGDGILGFVNAPRTVDKPQFVALTAALEILQMHKRLEAYYRDIWRTDFNIRIGINSGFASVGFYPSFQRGTYTAVGEPVNLAARLCSLALPNSICVPKDIIKSVSQLIENADVTPLGTVSNIKGFENEQFDLFSLTPVQSIENRETSRTPQCPACHVTLTLSRNLGGAVVLQCPNCEHRDIFEKQGYLASLM